MTSSGTIETRMNLIPDERIQDILTGFLSPEAAERLELTRREMGFRSIEGYKNTRGVPDIALMHFKELANGVNVPFYPHVTLKDKQKIGVNGRFSKEIAIGIVADLRPKVDIADGARRLDIADDRGFVAAGLKFAAEELASSGKVDEKWELLKRVIESERLQSDMRIEFRDEPLTSE